MNEVLEKDVAAESGKEQGIQRTYESLEALKAAIISSDKVREDYLKNQNEYSIAAPTEAPADLAQQESAAPAAPAKRKVTLEVDDELLGTYGKNREADAAILEALKGNKEKDKTISFLKDERVPALERELAESKQSLKKQLEEFEAKKAAEASQKPKSEKPKLPELPEIGDDEDLFDEAAQKKLRTVAKSIKETYAYISNLESEIATLKTTMTDFGKKREEETASATANARVAAEFNEIDSLISSNKDVLGEGRTFKEMQDDYIGFMDSLRVASGITAPLFNDRGEFSPEVQKQYSLFHEETDAGKLLRAQLEAKGIGLPKDFDTLQSAYAIREIRNQHFERGPDGNPVPINYSKALRLYQTTGPGVKTQPAAAADPLKKKTEIDKRMKAAENVANSARELPAGEGGAMVDVDNYPTDKFMAQMKKPVSSWTDFEVTLFKQVAKAKGLSDEWMKDYLGSRF